MEDRCSESLNYDKYKSTIQSIYSDYCRIYNLQSNTMHQYLNLHDNPIIANNIATRIACSLSLYI